MFYQLPNGHAIEMSLDKYLDMSDEEFNAFVARQPLGDSIENPWIGSILEKAPPEEVGDNDFDDFIDQHLKELPDISNYEKIEDFDTPDDEDY